MDAPAYWGVSQKHAIDLKNIVEGYSEPLKKFYGNKSIVNILYEIQSKCRNIVLLANETPALTNIQIGKLPIMLRSNICVLNQYNHIDNKISGECKMDPGGYFIINGSEKTCLGKERAAENQIYCYNQQNGGKEGQGKILVQLVSRFI
jgi:DNA-directed RNA polymerase beta subunit